jgi:hypothetical protein
MKKLITTFILFIAATNSVWAQFTPGNVVVLQAGDGSTALASTGNAIVLKEFSTTGTPTYSLSVPTTTAASTPLVISGSATSEGALSRSADGRFLVFGGYANLYSSSLASASATVAPRGVGYVDATGIYTRAVTSTSFYTGNNIRGAASDGNGNYWGAGASQGTNYFGTVSTATLIQGSITNSRAVNIFNNQLYLSTGSGTHGIYSIGTGTPTSPATATIAIATGSTSSPYQFFFNSTNTVCYIADDNSISSGGGIQKWTYNGTAWSLAYTLGTGTGSTVGARGVVADFSGTNPIVYATTAESSSNRLISIIDGGSTGTSTVTTLATASTSNTIFRGLAFSPICRPVAISSVTNTTPACSNSLGLNISTTGSAPLSYTWSGPGTFSSMSVKSPTVSAAATGIYSVSVSNGCGTATSSVTVNVNTSPVVSASTTNSVICKGTPTTLNGSGAVTYAWTGGAIDNVAFTPTATTVYTVTGTDVNGCTGKATVSVNVNNLPAVMANTTNSAVCTGNQIILSGSGATSYTWSSGVNNNSAFTPGGTATYTVTGTDNNNCVNTATVSVVVNSLPVISFTGKTTLCVWQIDTLNALGAVSYTWSPFNITGPQVIGGPNTPGNVTFTLTGTDANGCTNSISQLITVHNQPTLSVNASYTAVCSGNQTNLTASGANTYTWSNGISNGANFTPTSTGTYSVIGTDLNNCSDTTTITITVNNLPAVTANTTYSTVCAGNQVTLSGNGANTYTWSSGVNDNTAFTPMVTSTYTVSGTDNNNCVNTATVSVTVNNLPLVTANASTTTVCAGSQVTLSGSGANTYAWSGGVSDNSAFTPNATATYTVAGIDNNNCANTATITITVNNLPSVTANTSTTTVCAGTQVTLNGSGATTYVWSNGVNDNTAFTPSITTTYTVTGTDNNNCANTATVIVTVHNLPAVTVNTTNTAVCNGMQITLSGSGATSYTWSSGVNNNSAFTPTATATYTVTGTDNNNCTNTATVSVTVYNLPVVTANTTTTTVCLGNQVTLSGGGANTYTWSGGVTDNTAFSPTVTLTYTVTGADNNNCVNTATVDIAVINCTTTGISNVSQNAVNVYPNPTNGNFTIKVTSLPATVTLYDVNGKAVYAQQMKQEEENVELQLENGVYLLRLLSNGTLYNSRVLITK